MGLLFARREEREKALDYFRKARGLNPGDPLVIFRIAEILRYQKSFAEAEAGYREALALLPELSEARLQLGLLLLEAARHEEAETVFRELVEKEPDNAEAHHQLAVASARLARGEAARRHFERSLEIAPSAQETHLHYGNFLMQRGERALGEKHLLRFQELKLGDDRARALSARVELEPENVEAKRELVFHLLALGRAEDAAREAERFLARDPENPELRALLDAAAK
jgi:tetratricopeptide (TPR) repeat protein